jgi:acyl-coenzyme A thioesterase PaaI-like protein
MNDPATHLRIDHRLCGTPSLVEERTAEVRLVTTPEMAVDDRGLVHGGFVFGLADHAAMLAVNDENVVLAGADVRFTGPVVAGQVLVAVAVVADDQGRHKDVDVMVRRDGDPIMGGTFHCVVLDGHVLDR